MDVSINQNPLQKAVNRDNDNNKSNTYNSNNNHGDGNNDTLNYTDGEKGGILTAEDPIHQLANAFSVPWSPELFYSVRGAENVHIYFWVAKDIGWTMNNAYVALIFGGIALLWCAVLGYHAAHMHNTLDMWMVLVLICWLGGNLMWCYGEVVYNIEGQYNFAARWLMFFGVFLWFTARLWLIPNKFLVEDDRSKAMYKRAGLVPRFPSLLGNTWRMAEHYHSLFWLLKDICWNIGPRAKIAWVICFIPTLLLSVDFIWYSACAPRMAIDTAHYIMQLMWLIANFVWALYEQFLLNSKNDIPEPLLTYSPKTGRWIASWILLSTYVVLFALYCVWIPLTAWGLITPEVEDFRASGSSSGSGVGKDVADDNIGTEEDAVNFQSSTNQAGNVTSPTNRTTAALLTDSKSNTRVAQRSGQQGDVELGTVAATNTRSKGTTAASLR